MESSSHIVDVLRQFGVVFPKSSCLLQDHLETVGHLGELLVGRPEVSSYGD
jgi:hypothetical protein